MAVGPSGNATVRIRQDELECDDELWVVVERIDGASVVNATVTDANDDGRIAVRLDTTLLTRSPASTVRAVQPDVVGATKPGDVAGRASLPDGRYRVRIHQDIAVFRIGEVPTETATSATTSPPTTSPTNTTSTASTSTASTSTAVTSTTGPGLTVVATFLAVLAAALVGLGRRHV